MGTFPYLLSENLNSYSFVCLFQICESPKPCEIDPIKLREGDNVEVNMVSFPTGLKIWKKSIFKSSSL